MENPPTTGQTITLQQPVALDPGDNTIELVAIRPQPRFLRAGEQESALERFRTDRSARLHVLAVGINDYWDERLKLEYSVWRLR